jgi:hypothetical protein
MNHVSLSALLVVIVIEWKSLLSVILRFRVSISFTFGEPFMDISSAKTVVAQVFFICWAAE